MPSSVPPQPKLPTLILLCGLSVLSLNMFLPALPHIASTFSADYAVVNLSIAGYAAVTAVLQLVMGPLSDRFGRRPVMLSAIGIFVVASLGCLFATNIWIFLLFRMLQAAIIGGYTISLAVVRDTFPKEQAASRIGYMAMAWAVAPMLGPMLGGVLDDLFGWRANFLAFAVFGLAMFALCWFDLCETNTSPSAILARQFQRYPELFRSRPFWAYALCMAFSTGAFYAFLGGAPLVATTAFSISTSELGFYMGSITAGFIVGSFLSGRFSDRYPLTVPIVTGRLVACVGLTAGLVLTLGGSLSILLYFTACACVGVGNGLTMPGSNAGAMSVSPSLVGSAAGLSGAMTVAGGAVMSLITGVVLNETNAAPALLAMMLLSSALGLIAILGVVRFDRKHPRD